MNTSDSEAMFQCLDVFMKLNHSLLEPHLELIWTMLWKAEKTGGVSYNYLLSSLISTYVKLRQVSSVFPFKTFIPKHRELMLRYFESRYVM